MKERLHVLLIGALVLVFGGAFLFLPSIASEIYLSPDETAVAATAKQFLTTGSLTIPDELLRSFPWVHPRSFVTVGDALAPVGFLGMPMLVSLFDKLLLGIGSVLLTPLFVLLTMIPLWNATQTWKKAARLTVLLAWLSFPTVILYANRGLFPNLPMVCLAVWAAWLVWRYQSLGSALASGGLVGLALFIRPTEAPWMLLWMACAFFVAFKGESLKSRVSMFGVFLIPCALFLAGSAWAGHATYGEWFKAGYQFRDPVLDAPVVQQTSPASVSLVDTWPLGFHPRNIWFNVKSYVIIYLFPWFALSCAALLLLLRQRKWNIIIASIGTSFILAMMYGQGLYQDHVRLNEVSLANSFLRYLLPLVPFAALAAGFVVQKILERYRRVGLPLVASIALFLLIFNGWTALYRDDEGLIASRRELIRYTMIRREANQLLSPQTVVVSERSDKIFFPTFRAVSPLPAKDRLRRLLDQQGIEVVFFLRTVTDAQHKEWREAGIELIPLLEAGNETLYRANAL